MQNSERDRFTTQWRKYFGNADLPFAIFYSGACPPAAVTSPESDRCILSAIPLVKEGRTLCLSAESKMCGGARRYMGFAANSGLRDLEYFLSYGIPGKLKGERYKKSPQLVRKTEKYMPPSKAPKSFIVFKRWDKLLTADEPEVVVFIDGLDVIAGLFTLANYDESEPNAVICPFGSGCSSIVYHPYRELGSKRPRCILGMFDISARPFVGENVLSFAAPYPKFERMVDNMGESFLTTGSWKALRQRA